MCEKEMDMVVEEVQVGESSKMSKRLDTLESLIRELTNKEDGKPKERSRSKSSKKRREQSSSESELSSDSSSSSDSEEEERRSRRKKKRMSTKEKKRAKKEEKRRMRLERARKREWRGPSHREQFAVLDEAIKPIQAAKARARKEVVSRALREDLKEGEAVLLQRIKLLLLANSKSWVAARIYSGQVDVASDSEDKRRVRAATAEAAREMAQRRPFGPRRAAADGQQPAIQPAIREKPPTPQPRITGNSGPPECWSCGERGHVQWSCPRRLGARSGQVPLPHQREPADKCYEAKAVVEDGGSVWAVEEDVFLESYEEVCSVGDGYEGEWRKQLPHDVWEAEEACKILGRNGCFKVFIECD